MTAQSLAVSRPEAAKLLGISVPTLDRRLRYGELPSVKIGGRRLIPRDAIERALQPTLSSLLSGPKTKTAVAHV